MVKATAIISLEKQSASSLLRRILKRLGLTDDTEPLCRRHGDGLFIIQADPAVAVEAVDEIRIWPGVRRLALFQNGQRFAQPPDPTRRETVSVGAEVVFGGPEFVLIGGPCAVESRAQVMEIAVAVKEAGAKMLRGGAFKPRTSPYDFGGLGRLGLEYLAAARERTGLPIVTEVLHREDLDLVAETADMLQIGARNMYNDALLFAAGSHPAGRPILLKRAFGATIPEFLEAAEHILLGRFHAGIDEPRLVLCERGIRMFNDLLRFTFDAAAIPHLKARTALPIIADPSHAAGDRRYVEPLALTAAATGADGLLVEVSQAPEQALCDSAQCLSADDFHRLGIKATAIAKMARA